MRHQLFFGSALNYGNLFGLSKGMNLKGNQFNQVRANPQFL